VTDGAHQLTQLDSGVRVVSETVPSVRSVALGMWIGTGSRNEAPSQAGVSHFLEHLLFKGTDRHTATEIAEIFDGLGGALNAATSKETTNLHARFLDTHTERAFDLMADMLLGPTYPEIDSEREVVLEEIAMYEDEPQDKVHDILGAAVFGDHPLGRPVIGRAQVISSIPVDEISAYHRDRYVGGNIVIAAAGNVAHESVVALAEAHVHPPPGDAGSDHIGGGGAEKRPTVLFSSKETEQYHFCLGALGMPRADERRFALGVLDSIFGGATSSRLFQEIREKRGLAYSVGSYTEHFVDTGMVAIYLGTREDNLAQACEIIGRELERLPGSISDEDLERSKEHVKGRMVLAMESTAARMVRIGKSILLDTPLLTLDEMLARVDAVTLEDLEQLALDLYTPSRFSAACIGTDEGRFRSALEGVTEALAA
jgi:predicted Zn-dependent peptidase